MSLEIKQQKLSPLDKIPLPKHSSGTYVVFDGRGREYARIDADTATDVVVSGALGSHQILLLDDAGKVVDTGAVRVDCRTSLTEDTGEFERLFNAIFDTMDGWGEGDHALRINGKRYSYFVSWIRDHVHTLKGMKYFTDDIKSAIELYADYQREDGMIWDKVKQMLPADRQYWRDWEFAEGDFIRKIPGNPDRRFQRIPVENDVEYLWIEGLYYTWKACGDDDWMKDLLDNAIRAVRYATSDPYRWSETFGLLKRGYTIDSWDFQHADDIAISGSAMRVDLQRTKFGVMFGDNTGMAAACRYLAEMLRTAGRGGEAPEFEQLAATLKQRVDDLAWNGEFYTHHVSEDPSFKRDVGDTDESAQVCQSNAYSLNRGLTHAQCLAIIKTYQRIGRNLPPGSPGEYYAIYPPFDNGFNFPPGDYMNAGVTTICAGELAHGAFEHGCEEYGVDILTRVADWAEAFNGHLNCCLTGMYPEKPERSFATVSLADAANVDLHGDGAEGVVGWTGEGANDMSGLPVGTQTFCDIEFDIVDPAANGRRAVLGIASGSKYKSAETVDIGARAESIYLLHACNGRGQVGEFNVHYEDGASETQYVNSGKQIDSWFMPAPDVKVGGRFTRPLDLHLAWWGANRKFENVGVFVYGWNNPHPDKTITRIEFVAAQTNVPWFICGLTRCDAPVYFAMPGLASSHGIPDNWGAAAVLYGLIEGLAGTYNAAPGFAEAKVVPRWTASDVNEVDIAAVLPASEGYVRYRYKHDGKSLSMELAANADKTRCEVLLPPGSSVRHVKVNGAEVSFEMKTIEESAYCCFDLAGIGAKQIDIKL